MIVPPETREVEGVKASVTDTSILDTMRSDVCIPKETLPTCPTMLPEATGIDGRVSTELASVTPTAPGVAAPIVKPDSVTATDDAGTEAPAVVITTVVAVVGLHVPNNAATLLLPTDNVGMIDCKKKPDG